VFPEFLGRGGAYPAWSGRMAAESTGRGGPEGLVTRAVRPLAGRAQAGDHDGESGTMPGRGRDMMDILVGVDGSADADAALRWAMGEASLRGSSVTALLAWAPDDCPTMVLERADVPGAHGIEAAAQQVLQEAVRRVQDPQRPVGVAARAVHRDAADALLDAAGRAEMLVVGHRGAAGRLHRLLMGSVSGTCLHKATGPVVVVRADPGRQTAAAGEHRMVLVGVDGSPASISALRWAAREAELRGAPLRVVHAWAPVPPMYAGYYTGIDGEVMEKAARAVLDESTDQGLTAATDINVDARLMVGGAAQNLITAAAGAQLLVLGARGHGGFAGLLLGSTTHQCLHHAPCPVAVIHGPRT
jgi:nucleotide-binding universal stress UspA family protein